MALKQTEMAGSHGPLNFTRQIAVLIAEDDLQLLLLYQSYLKRENYKVFTARDCVEAVNGFIRFRPDVVIVDYRMPAKNGLDAAMEMRVLNPNVKIIMLTADDTIQKDKAERAGIDIFLKKPVSLGLLLNSIRTLADLKDPSRIINAK